MKGWKTYRLGDLYEFSSGLSKNRKYFGYGHDFVSFKDVFYNYYLPDELTSRVDSSTKERAQYSVRRGDVFLTRTSETMSELGYSSVALKDYPNATFNGFTKRLRPKSSDKIVPEFAAYYFRSPEFRAMIGQYATMTTRASLNNEILGRLTIQLPPIHIQEEIGEILKILDDKIELNNRINENLEAMAQAIFKRWFIDFEFPDEEGKPYKSSGGKMVASELGEIPEGWRWGKLGEILSLEYGKALRASIRIAGEYPVVGSSGVVGSHRKHLVEGPGIVIGRKGTIGEVIWLEKSFFPIDTTFYVQNNLEANSLYFHYFLLKSQDFKKVTSDSAVPGLNRNEALKNTSLIPSSKPIREFNAVVCPMFERMTLNSNQNKALTQIRDTLLPRLMSGNLEIKIV